MGRQSRKLTIVRQYIGLKVRRKFVLNPAWERQLRLQRGSDSQSSLAFGAVISPEGEIREGNKEAGGCPRTRLRLGDAEDGDRAKAVYICHFG